MNEELYYLYRDLPPLQQQHIQEIFQKSQKMQLLIEILEEKGKALTTVQAVNFIYKEELAHTHFKVLTNRFYKLRKELKDWLLQQLKHSPVCFTKEEQELLYLRQLVITNEYTAAYEKLLELEQHCWKLNLFELLPEIIELKIRSLQYTYNPDIELQSKALEGYQLANDLLLLLNQMKAIGFEKSFDFSFEQDADLQKLQKNIRPYKAYPRFKMTYHNICFSKGFAKIDANRQLLSRHLNSYKKLKAAHPAIPSGFYERHYQDKDFLYFSIKEASYYTNMNAHKKALALLKKVIEVEQNSSMYLRKNLGYLMNNFIIALCAQDYDFTLVQIAEYEAFGEANPGALDNYPMPCIWLDFYSQAFPFYQAEAKQLEEWMTFSLNFEAQQDVLYRGLRQVVHFKIYILQKKWAAAKEVINNAHSLAFYKIYGQNFDFQSFFNNLLTLVQQKDKTAFYLFQKETKKEQDALKLQLPPVLWSWLTWARQLCNHYKNKK